MMYHSTVDKVPIPKLYATRTRWSRKSKELLTSLETEIKMAKKKEAKLLAVHPVIKLAAINTEVYGTTISFSNLRLLLCPSNREPNGEYISNLYPVCSIPYQTINNFLTKVTWV